MRSVVVAGVSAVVVGLVPGVALGQACSGNAGCAPPAVCVQGTCVLPPPVGQPSSTNPYAPRGQPARPPPVGPAPGQVPPPAQPPYGPPPGQQPVPPTGQMLQQSPGPAAVGTVDVATAPPGALIVVDGQALGPAPGRLSLTPGPHSLELRLEGHEAERRQLSIQPGSFQQLSVTLTLTAAEQERRAAAEKAEQERRAAAERAEQERRAAEERAAAERARQAAEAKARYQADLATWEKETAPARAAHRTSSVVGGILTGVGLALAGTATGFLIRGVTMGNGEYGGYLDYTGREAAVFSSYRDRIFEARSFLVISSVLGGVGLPTLISGIVVLATRPRVPPRPADPGVSVSLVPTAGGAFVTMGGSF